MKINKEDLEKKIRALDKFPGNLEEYSELKNNDYVIMDTGKSEKFVRLNETELLSTLIEGGCVALVRYNPNLVLYEINFLVSRVFGETKLKEFPYGIPVRISGKD